MTRNYQNNYSELKAAVFDTDMRSRKANTIVRVCRDFVDPGDLKDLHVLDVGSSSGIIDNYLADHFGQVTGIDIDEPAMAHARQTFNKENLAFEQGDVMQLSQEDNSIDAIICTQIYEHVPDAKQMFREIFRVLRPGGFCYFAGNNRIMLMEPHYKLPLLSVIPRPLAHRYMRLTGKGEYYHEKHFTRGTLRRLCAKFKIEDYSEKVIASPEKYGVDYMLPPASLKWRAAHTIARHAGWAAPMIWILEKPEAASSA